MENTEKKKGFFDNPILRTKIKSANVKPKEMLIGYFLGPFGALLASGFFTSYLNTYFTDVYFAGNDIGNFLSLMPLISTIFIVIGNLLVGQLVEKLKTSAGKARPLLLLSSITLAISCILMFIIPSQNIMFKMVWLAITYNLYYSVAYPLYNTANSTMIPVSTRNASQRGLLASITNVAGLAVMGAGSIVFPLVVGGFLKNANGNWLGVGRWTILMVVIGVFTAICCLLQYWFTRERVTEETINLNTGKEKISIKKQFKAVGGNGMWWLILGFYFFFQISGAVKNASLTYFCYYVLKPLGELSGDAFVSTFGIVGAIPMAIAVLFVWPLSNKFGKRTVTLVGMVIGVCGGILAGLAQGNAILVMVGIALKCLGSAPACYMILAMIADVLDHLEAKNGFRSDGLTMSIYSAIMVASTGIGTAILQGLLSANGYIAPVDMVQQVQPQSAIDAITTSYIWIETVAYGICAIILIFFGVEKHLKDDQAKIVERQKQEVLAKGEEWIEPAERLKIEQEKAEQEAEVARIEESKAYCIKKGLDFEKVEGEYQQKLADKKEKARLKAQKKEKNSKK